MVEPPPTEEGAGGAAVLEQVEVEAPPRLLDEEEAARAYAQAMQVHISAREQRARCDDEDDAAACDQATQLFGLAADTWRTLVRGRPDHETPEWIFMLSQALFHSGRPEASAEQADRYLTTDAPDWRAQAARLLVSARERALEAAGVRPREEPPAGEGDAPVVRAVEVPAPLAALAEARARFVEVMAEDTEESETRRAYALENALLRYRYGDWENARAALRPIFEAGCSGHAAWEGAATAWRTLRSIAAGLGRHDAVRALGEEIDSRQCTFIAGPPSCGEGSEDPRCIARADRVAWRLRGGMQFLERAQRSRGADRRQFAVRAGEAFLAALEVEGELGARGRVEALVEAVRSFRLAGDAERAAAVDERIVGDVRSDALEESDRPFGLAVAGAALARQREAAVARADNEQIVELSRRLLAPELDLPPLAAARARARAGLPEVLTGLGQHGDASTAFASLAAASDDPGVRREAELRSALSLVEARGCGQGSRALRRLISSHEGQPEAHDAVVRARWRLAECQRRGSRRHTALLELIAGTGQPGLGTDARDHMAESAFLLADRGFEADTRFRIRVPRGGNIEDMVPALQEQLAAPVARVRERIAGYNAVARLGVGRWVVAARQRSGAALEALDRAVVDASWELPTDIASQRRTLSARIFAFSRRVVETRATSILETQAAPLRCRAASYYRGAIESAGTSRVESEESRAAQEHLEALALPDRCPRERSR